MVDASEHVPWLPGRNGKQLLPFPFDLLVGLIAGET